MSSESEPPVIEYQDGDDTTEGLSTGNEMPPDTSATDES